MSDLLDFLRTHEEAFRSRNRLTSLYSDFRLQKSTNPDGYQANSSAWLRALTAASRAGLLPSSRTGTAENSQLSFASGNELERALQTQQWGRPLALGAVIQDAVDRKELIPLRDYLNAKTSVYAKSWIPSPWQVVSWGLKQLGLGFGGGQDKLAVGDFVVMANVEAAANAVLAKAAQNGSSLTSRIYSRELFESEFAHVLSSGSSTNTALSSTDFSILLAYLTREKPTLACSSSGNTIKFKPSTSASPEPVTEQDENIASLRTLIATLETQTLALQSRIDALDFATREAVSKRQTTQAKSSLRSKKLAESTLEKRTATLAQLEDVYAKIEQASDQVAVVRVMESSASVLRSLNKEVGGVEGVENVVDKLREEMADVDEVGRVLNEAGVEGVDEGEVDEEMENLEREEREKREAAERRAREERESKEAEEMKRRLQELDVPGREPSEGEKAGKEKEETQGQEADEMEVDPKDSGQQERQAEPAT